MPNLPYRHHINPRDFERARKSVEPLSHAVTAAVTQLSEQNASGALVVVWLSDLHLHAPRDYGSTPLGRYGTDIDTSASLRLALEEVQALRPAPDLVVLGGDLADTGHNAEGPLDEYLELKAVLDEGLPAHFKSLPILGNHDHSDVALTADFQSGFRSWRRADWPEPVEQEDFYYTVIRSGWRIIALDTRFSHPLGDRQRDWLQQQLSDEQTPTIILQHRPYVCCGNWVDEYRCTDEITLHMISRSPQVKAVLSGHTHKVTARTYKGAMHTILPAVAYGIDDVTGWACLILSPQHAPQIFVKQLSVQFANETSTPGDSFRKLELLPG